jgi:uncharacterized protein YndB with AHSA1/START domain
MNGSPAVQLLSSDQNQLNLSADFSNFTPQELFEYFTTPHLITQWWPETAEIDARLHGKYRLGWPSMSWELFGKFTRFEPGQRLAYSWKWKHAPDLPERQVDILFETLGDGARLTLTHGAYMDNSRDRADRQSHLDGWSHFLARLQNLVREGADKR